MSQNAGNEPVTREDLREILRDALRESRGSDTLVTKVDIPKIIDNEVGAARGDIPTRAEIRELINDKISGLEAAVDGIKENMPSKESVARAESNAGFAIKGFWVLFAAILTIIVTIIAAAVGKYFLGE